MRTKEKGVKHRRGPCELSRGTAVDSPVFGAPVGLWTELFFSRSHSFPIGTLGREWACLVFLVPFKLRNNSKVVITRIMMVKCGDEIDEED